MIRDRRRIDPTTGSVRDAEAGSGPLPNGESGGAQAGAAAPASAADAPTAVDNEEFARITADLAERTADLQRVTAEYANYRKRMDRDREALTVTAKAAVASELLSVLDDLELAQRHGDLKGAFKAVADRLVGALERIGLQGYGAEGEPFDPAHHEAVQFSTSTDVDAPTVTAVLRRGYSFQDRPLRAAVVAVTGPEHDGSTSGDDVGTSDSDDPGAVDPAATTGGGPVDPDSFDADEQDRQDDARARAEQESRRPSAPNLSDESTTAGNPAPTEDPA